MSAHSNLISSNIWIGDDTMWMWNQILFSLIIHLCFNSILSDDCLESWLFLWFIKYRVSSGCTYKSINLIKIKLFYLLLCLFEITKLWNFKIYEPILMKISMNANMNWSQKVIFKFQNNLFLRYIFCLTPNLLKTFQECQHY